MTDELKMTENAVGYSVTSEIINMPRNIHVPNQTDEFTVCLFSKRKNVNLSLCTTLRGVWGRVVVEALRYKSEGPGIDFRCRRGFFRGIRQFDVPWS